MCDRSWVQDLVVWCNGYVLPLSVCIGSRPGRVVFKTWSCGVMVSVLPSCVIDLVVVQELVV